MEAVLVAMELWDVVGPEEEELVPKGPKGVTERKKKQRMAKAQMVLYLDASQLPFVEDLEDPRKVWSTLQEMHRSSSMNSLLTSHSRFHNMSMAADESVLTYISRVRRAALEMKSSPVPIREFDQILQITAGLPESYAPVIRHLNQMEYSKISMQIVIGLLVSHEDHLNRYANGSEGSDPYAMLAHTRSKHNRDDKDDSKIICFNCRGIGHRANVCPSPKLAANVAVMEEVKRAKVDDDDEPLELF